MASRRVNRKFSNSRVALARTIGGRRGEGYHFAFRFHRDDRIPQRPKPRLNVRRGAMARFKRCVAVFDPVVINRSDGFRVGQYGWTGSEYFTCLLWLPARVRFPVSS